MINPTIIIKYTTVIENDMFILFETIVFKKIPVIIM